MEMTPVSPEEVVLVDEDDRVLGTMSKSVVHGAATPLHRGFSLFLFDRTGRLLLQQRSHTKTTWPLAWSNSVCGHPALHESNIDAAQRRLAYELGMSAAHIKEISSYRFTFVHDGVMENEICPILVGLTDEEPKPNPEEVEAVRWIAWPEFLQEIRTRPGFYSEWCEEEARILTAHPRFKKFLLETSILASR
jgi:isopentenyl-diphosphate delta-isomerase